MATPFDVLIRFRTRTERALVSTAMRLPRVALRRIAGPPRRSPEGFALDLQIQTLLRLAEMSGQGDTSAETVAEARTTMERNGRLFDRLTDAPVAHEDRTLDGPGGMLPIRVYTPAEARKPVPTVVYFHGGGFALGSIDSHHNVCQLLADRARAVVVSVAYRLAPEHKFPAAVDDALAATRWALAHAEELGGSRAVAVAGDSAGGNLSAVVSLALRDDRLRPAHQFLLYPATDFTRSFESHRHFASGYLLTEASISWFIDHYLNDHSEERDPRASPWFTTDVRGTAPATVLVAGFDPLRDEGRAFASKLRDAGVPAELRTAESLVHGFASMTGGVRTAATIFDAAARRLGETLRAWDHAIRD